MSKKKKYCKKPRDNPYYYNPEFKAPGKRRGKLGKKRVLERINHKKFHKARNGEAYYSRNLILKEIGFDSYKDYLKSNLWKNIRQEVLTRDKNNCQICGCHGTQVHHSRYHKNDLLGNNLKFLHCLCGECHHKIEFKEDKKVWMDEALIRQKSLIITERFKNETEKEYQEKYGYLDAEFNSIFRNF